MKSIWQLCGLATYKTIGRFVVPFIINNTVRTRVLLVHKNEVLLCRSWLSGGDWNLAGGGLKKGESVLDGAQREVYEELHVHTPKKELVLLGNGIHKQKYYTFRIEMLFVKIQREKPKRRWPEITDAKWFNLNSLPSKLDNDVKETIQRYLKYGN